MKAKPTRGNGWACGSLPLVPVDANVLRLPAAGDDVLLAVAVQVRDRQVFHRDAAVVEDEAVPLLALAVGVLVDSDAALLGEGVALRRVIAHTDHEFIILVAVEVGEPDG